MQLPFAVTVSSAGSFEIFGRGICTGVGVETGAFVGSGVGDGVAVGTGVGIAVGTGVDVSTGIFSGVFCLRPQAVSISRDKAMQRVKNSFLFI